MRYKILALSGVVLASIWAMAGLAAPYSARDVLAFTRIATVVASPSAKQTAYVTFARDKHNAQAWRYVLHLKQSDGAVKELAQAAYIGALQWSPDGKRLAYVMPHAGKTELRTYQLQTGSTWMLLSLSRSIDLIKWSPSGKQIAFVADEVTPHRASGSSLKNMADVVNSQLFVTANTNKQTGYKALTSATVSIADSVFANSINWSPSGKDIAFSYQPSPRPVDQLYGKIAILNLATHQTTIVPYCQQHTCHSPVYSPDGKWLAFESNVKSSGRKKLLMQDIDKYKKICVADQALKVHCLNNTADQNPFLLGWSSSGRSLFVGDLYKTTGPQLYEIDLKSNVAVKQVSKQPYYMEPLTISLNRSGKVFGFGYEQVNTAPEPYIAAVHDFKMHQVASINANFGRQLGKVRVINWRSSDGTPIQGLLTVPTDYKPGHHYPLYVDIHGGPVGAQAKRYLGGSDEFSQAITPTDCVGHVVSLGYVVLQVNYRGSGGYGLDFRMKDFGDLGGGDYQDIVTGIKNLVKGGVVDKRNIVVAGWSYGGYLTAWAVSHDQYRAAIDGDGFTDLISFTGTSDDTDFFERYLGSYFWQGSQALYWRLSPMAHVQHIKTPLLILQGESDVRVPLGQAQELYNALTVLRQPVKMLVAPNTGHVPTEPGIIEQEIKAIDQQLS